MSSQKPNKSSRRDLARKRAAAVAKYYAKHSVVIDGSELGAKDLIEIFHAVIQTEDTVDQLRAALRTAIDARAAAGKKADRYAKALEGIVAAAYGTTSEAFAEFGFVARKTADKSAKTKALAVEKLLATREARHTMGHRQKAQVHGDAQASHGGTTPQQPNGTSHA